jgi:hypothetical protein
MIMLDYKPITSHVVSREFAEVYDRFVVCSNVLKYLFVSFYALQYVFVSLCIYFLFCICIKYWLVRILSLVVSYIHPSRQITCS